MNHAISLERASQMITRYREQKEKMMSPEYSEKNLLPIAESFDRAAFDKVLSQPGCTGLRIYYGMNEDLQLRAIIVGLNEKNEDLLPADPSVTDGTIIEDGMMCPPVCAPASLLNP